MLYHICFAGKLALCTYLYGLGRDESYDSKLLLEELVLLI